MLAAAILDPPRDPAGCQGCAGKRYLDLQERRRCLWCKGKPPVRSFTQSYLAESFSHLFWDWAVPGCSNCFWPGATTASGHALLSRNYDFSTGSVFELMGQPSPPDARPATSRPFLIETHPDEGRATLLMTSYELLGSALDGINDAGVAIALMATVEAFRGAEGSPAWMERSG